jgi:tRNA pseudouridine38-40 synthase
MSDTYLLTICFDGRNYAGWQIQENAVTVMQVFQEALWCLLKQKVAIKGCSRTDSKVHAKKFYVSFVAEHSIPCDRFPDAVNALLPPSIAAIECRRVPNSFHARYSAVGKRYVYKIFNGRIRNPFLEGLAWHIPRSIDESLINLQAQSILGRHDFSSFCAAGSSVVDRVRTVTQIAAQRKDDLIEISICADGFLYNMARIIVGTLVDIERGALDKDTLSAILQAKDRRKAGKTAPACGLWLDEVFYVFDN